MRRKILLFHRKKNLLGPFFGKYAGYKNLVRTPGLTAPTEPPEAKPLAFNPPPGTVGVSYYYDVRNDFEPGNKRPSSYTLASGTLPNGLTLSNTGLITGQPTTEETATNISVTGTNDYGSDTTNTASIAIDLLDLTVLSLPLDNHHTNFQQTQAKT